MNWLERITGFAILNYRVCGNLYIPSRIMINDEATEVVGDGIGLRFGDRNYRIDFGVLSMFEPIPVTSEILDKTIFKKINEGIYSANTDTGIPITLVLLEDYCLFRFGRVEYKFRYFSELQYLIYTSVLPGGTFRWYNVRELFPSRIFCEIGMDGKIKIGQYERRRVAK